MIPKHLFLLAAVLLATAPVVRAGDDDHSTDRPPDLAKEAAAFLTATDVNKDGKISRPELLTFMQARIRNDLERELRLGEDPSDDDHGDGDHRDDD